MKSNQTVGSALAGDKESSRDALSSPCVRNCCLNDQDVCLGCFRSIEEICAWSAMDSAGRKKILDSAKERKRRADLKT